MISPWASGAQIAAPSSSAALQWTYVAYLVGLDILLIVWPVLGAAIVSLWFGTSLGVANRPRGVALHRILLATVAAMAIYMTHRH